MTHDANVASDRTARAAAFAVAAITLGVFWRTAYPTITWWDSGSYSTAAATMGLTSPPGSLLLTLLGWPITKLPLGISPAYALNLFAGVLAATTATLVFIVARELARLAGASPASGGGSAAAIGAAVGALAFAFGSTLWEYATRFTPYVLTALFTGLILWTMLRWWRDAADPLAWRWLLLLAFLFGLDFSVHRTNALLMPGALAFVLVRDARVMLRWRTWAAAAGGMAIGLAFHLLVIPIARTTESPINMFPPTTLAAFWDFVSLENQGGGFRLQVWPRNADFWSVQLADFARTMRDNFLNVRGPLGPFGALPALAGTIGAVSLWLRHRRLAVGMLIVLASHAALTVFYFNIPDAYFRSLDRHYLPVAVTLGVFVAYGVAMSLARLAAPAAGRSRAFAVVALIAAVVPGTQLTANWTAQDSSQRYFAYDYAVNALEALPENAIYVTVGDNDTFPVLYAQAVENVRPDVRIVNLSMANTEWHLDQLRRADPEFPLTLTADQRSALVGLSDTTIAVPVSGSPADTVRLRVVPQFGPVFIQSDVVMMDVVSTNAWRRPITFASTAGPLPWLASNARLDGLHWVALPDSTSSRETGPLQANLFNRYRIRGLADSASPLERESIMIAIHYVRAFNALMAADALAGRREQCRHAARLMLALIPPDRLGVPQYDGTSAGAQCGRSE